MTLSDLISALEAHPELYLQRRVSDDPHEWFLQCPGRYSAFCTSSCPFFDNTCTIAGTDRIPTEDSLTLQSQFPEFFV